MQLHHAHKGRPGIDRPLRILFASYRSHPHTGGQGVYLRLITKALADLGHLVAVASGPPYPELDPRVGLIELPSLDLYEKPRDFFGFPSPPWAQLKDRTNRHEYIAHISGAFAEAHTFGQRLASYLADHHHEFDILQDNQTLCRGLLQIQQWGLPVIGLIHHPITKDREIALEAVTTFGERLLVKRWYSFLNKQKIVARSLDPIVVVSQSTQRDVTDAFGCRPDQLYLIHHGIDHETWRPIDKIDRKSNRLIAVASADVPLKGLTYLVEALAAIKRERPNVKLTVVGKLRDGETKVQIERHGLANDISFVSGLTDEDIVTLYAKSTVAVSPSVYEGFGFPAGEAMSCGVPVVATTGGSLSEVVGDAGILVPPRDPDALTNAILNLLGDRDKQRQLSRAGRNRVLEMFQWSRAATQMTNLYTTELAHHANNPAE